jgi:hypothetical protein
MEKKSFFCISMLQVAENCPQCSFHLKYTAQQKKLDIQECIKHDLELVYEKKFFLYFNVATC